MTEKRRISRRGFLKISGAVAGAAVFAGAIGAVSVTSAQEAPMNHGMKDSVSGQSGQLRAKMFFTDYDDFNTLSHAVERIFPKDKTGPGAIELFVPYFIDNQLASAYGLNAREYIQGPFKPGTPQQNYQTPLIRADIFRQGILAIKNESQSKYKKLFTELTGAQKDDILTSFEKGAVVIDGVPSAYFFSLLRTMTLAGVYADPVYNGNNNMNGWVMKQYPGAQMSYLDSIMESKFKVIEPVSLASMQ